MPEFWWEPQATFTSPWRPVGTPAIGTAWYKKTNAPESELTKGAADANSEVVRVISLILQERTEQIIADWRTGEFTSFAKKTVVLTKPLAGHGRDVDAVLARYPQALRVRSS